MGAEAFHDLCPQTQAVEQIDGDQGLADVELEPPLVAAMPIETSWPIT